MKSFVLSAVSADNLEIWMGSKTGIPLTAEMIFWKSKQAEKGTR